MSNTRLHHYSLFWHSPFHYIIQVLFVFYNVLPLCYNIFLDHLTMAKMLPVLLRNALPRSEIVLDLDGHLGTRDHGKCLLDKGLLCFVTVHTFHHHHHFNLEVLGIASLRSWSSKRSNDHNNCVISVSLKYFFQHLEECNLCNNLFKRVCAMVSTIASHKYHIYAHIKVACVQTSRYTFKVYDLVLLLW